MSLSRRSIRGAWGKIVLVSLGAPLGLLATDGCTQQQVATSLRSLERSGRISFVCLNAPGTRPSAGRSLNDCSSVRFDSPDAYGILDGETTQPHLYALVTQTTRGEVAVIDMSTKGNSVLDQNPRVPGANFLPIGAQPVDIVSTRDGDATFVGVAEIGRQGIFAIPSSAIRSCSGCAPKTLSDWPACALPGAPGNMLVIDDPPVNEEIRASCDGTYEPIRASDKDSKGNDLIDVTDGKQVITDNKGDVIETKFFGRPKIVTTIPELGAIAVIDAQTLFDAERDANGKPLEDENGVVYKHPPGSWKACPIERWVPLSTKVPVSNPPPSGTGGPACVDAPIPAPAAQVEFESRPSGLARTEDKLFVADIKAPVIHTIDMKTPCEPIEGEPLLPSSRENPGRVVTTNAISASGTLASSLDQFVYAVDDFDGSLMVFDVGPSSTSRRPLSREHQEWAPFQPSDRVDFGVPIQDLALIEHDAPQPIPATGIAVEGIRCSPDPDLPVCTSDSASCDPRTLYRTSANYDRGAGPTRMRGAFAYLVLSTGQIAVVDIDDYDKDCRFPRRPSYLNGCSFDKIAKKGDKDLLSSWEVSCNVVVPHTLRDANYMGSGDKIGQNQPGLANFPTLYNNQGALQSTFDQDGVIMRATLPNPPPPPPQPEPPELEEPQFNLAVGTSVWTIDSKTGLLNSGEKTEHGLASNWEDPHAHTTLQSFTVEYEGGLPGFFGKSAKLSAKTTPGTLSDVSSRFCDQGVLGQKAFTEMLMAEDSTLTKAEAEKRALKLADYVQIAADTPVEDDVHWQSAGVQNVCSFEQCKGTFGPLEIPKTTRDLKIIEAYQDHLEVEIPNSIASIVDCCFPTHIGFNVRVGSQWSVVGTASGFIHHVIPTSLESSSADRSVGVCRNSCDPRDVRKNGRVRSIPHGTVIKDGDPRMFINPFFRFVINDPVDGNVFDGNPILLTDYKVDMKGVFILDANGQKIPTSAGEIKLADNAPERGTFFQFSTQGSFKPLLVNLASTTTEIQPQSISFVPPTGEVVIVDGSLEGIILLNASRLDITRRYF